MKEPKDKLKVALFSGGRGTGSIASALLKHPNIDLTLLVNAYDDGLSTGLLRRFIPGMLGPSDIRKNVSQLLKLKSNPSAQALSFLLEYRLSSPLANEQAVVMLRNFIEWDKTESIADASIQAREELTLSQLRTASKYLQAFLDYYQTKSQNTPWFTFADMSLGNLFFAGCYLINSSDFNQAIKDFSRFAAVGERILNVTQGEGFILAGIKESGQFLADEASIVGPQDASRIEEIFLLATYLPTNIFKDTATKVEKIRFLREKEMVPQINPLAQKALREADIIIYGPGTQYSSLLPSYLTLGMAEVISANTKAEKVFIANIARDYDILGEDATTLVKAFLWNISRKATILVLPQQLVSRFFFQKPEATAPTKTVYVPFNAQEFAYSLEKVSWIDWEGEAGKHSGSRTVSELLLIVEARLRKRIKHLSQKVSIIVPALNEERTIKQVLKDLQDLPLQDMNLEKEIIVVDGGSTDQTYALASQEGNVRTYQVTGKKRGRGLALRLGLAKAKGDIAVFFPSDGEYQVNDVLRVVGPLVTQEFPAVFGSRAFRSNDLNGTLKRVYGKKGALFMISKYGGIALSILTLLIYQRFISDPLTSIKGFNMRIFRGMLFICNGVDFDMELIAKIARAENVILEVPVSYQARTVAEGKKITVWDGIACLLTLLQFSRWKPHYAKNINRHSGL